MSGWWIALIVLGVYLALAALLFVFPSLVHKRRAFVVSERILNSKRVAAFSHRGGQKEFPENSLSAFKNSIRQGFFGLELDVHRTRCGQLVIAHDVSLQRITGQDVLIRDVQFADIGNYLHVIHDAWSQVDDDFSQLPPEKPPLLEDLFRLVRNESVVLSIDLKSNDPDDFSRVCTMILDYGLQDRVVVGGFSSKQCKQRMRSMGISLPMFFDVRDCLVFFLATFFWVLPFTPFQNDWLMIPHAFQNFYAGHVYKNFRLAKLAGFIFWVEKWYFCLVSWHMNRRGIPVVFWVLNNRSDWQLGLGMGANGLMTDYPSRLRAFLEEKQLFGHI